MTPVCVKHLCVVWCCRKRFRVLWINKYLNRQLAQIPAVYHDFHPTHWFLAEFSPWEIARLIMQACVGASCKHTLVLFLVMADSVSKPINHSFLENSLIFVANFRFFMFFLAALWSNKEVTRSLLNLSTKGVVWTWYNKALHKNKSNENLSSTILHFSI